MRHGASHVRGYHPSSVTRLKGMHEPTTDRDTVCFVVEFFQGKCRRRFQLRILQDFCVKRCYPVYAKSVVDIHKVPCVRDHSHR